MSGFHLQVTGGGETVEEGGIPVERPVDGARPCAALRSLRLEIVEAHVNNFFFYLYHEIQGSFTMYIFVMC